MLVACERPFSLPPCSVPGGTSAAFKWRCGVAESKDVLLLGSFLSGAFSRGALFLPAFSLKVVPGAAVLFCERTWTVAVPPFLYRVPSRSAGCSLSMGGRGGDGGVLQAKASPQGAH